MDSCYVFFSIAGLVLALYFTLELHYFLRICLSVICARISRKKVHILDETTITGVCLTTDIDTLLTHMNNARAVRELDFAKADFHERTGLWRAIRRRRGGGLALAATAVRYRRYVRLFTRYRVTTKIIYWDEQSIYMEHRIISPKDGFINAIALCKTRLVNCNAAEIMEELLSEPGNDNEKGKSVKPEPSPELVKWMESNEISSAMLRGQATN